MQDGLKAVPYDHDDTTMTTTGITKVEDGLEAVLDDYLLYQRPVGSRRSNGSAGQRSCETAVSLRRSA